MQGFSTLTQKGQVAIPKQIRDYFGLKPSDKLFFKVKNNEIVAFPVPSIKEMYGIVPAKKPLARKKMKEIIRKAVVEKYRRKIS